MYFNLALIIATFMVTFVAALPRPAGSALNLPTIPTLSNTCKTGIAQCCESVQAAESVAVQEQASALGVLTTDIPATENIGINCTPLDALSVAGKTCTQQPTCCTGNNILGGLLATGCSLMDPAQL